MPLDYGSGTIMEYGPVLGKPFTPQYSATSVTQIAQQISMSKPIGGKIKSIVIMPTATPGWAMLNNKHPENTAIAVGLLVPAVQKIRDSPSSNSDLGSLRAVLDFGGILGVTLRTELVWEAIVWL